MENEKKDIHNDAQEEITTATHEQNMATEQLLEDIITENEETAALQEQIDVLKDKYVRLMAEFDNFRKRVIKEKADIIATASKDTMTALLPVLDDFERAQKSEGTFSEGIQLVYHKLHTSLRNLGLRPINTATGTPFDAEYQEAITEIAAGEELSGKIVDTIEQGYTLNDKIIRFAKVVVGK
ncbi:MAG: nucleotide exchange factor GrpE [Saprospiraceae bacterium]|nr:nucleotide exchange factor GrpE [Saprospiraceae bacterium]MBP7679568.1 nucleotide exchange factor GrpE [Saprospiraceae bacterium]